MTPKKSMDCYWYFPFKIVQFGMFWVLILKIDTLGIFPAQFWPWNKNLLSKLKNLINCGILKMTSIYNDEPWDKFQNSMLGKILQFRLEIHIQWPKLSGKNAPYVNFWNQHSKHSKLDDFERKISIKIHALFLCQKLPKINS